MMLAAEEQAELDRQRELAEMAARDRERELAKLAAEQERQRQLAEQQRALEDALARQRALEEQLAAQKLQPVFHDALAHQPWVVKNQKRLAWFDQHTLMSGFRGR